MSKYLIWLGMAVLMLISGCFWGSSILFLEKDTIGKTNLLGNPLFEKTDVKNPALPAGWVVVSETAQLKEPVSIDENVTNGGKKSVCVKDSDHDLMLLSDAFKIDYNGGFFIKFAAKSEHRLDQPLKLNFWTYDAAGKRKNKFSTTFKPGIDWKKATISAGFLSNSVSFARVSITVPRLDDNTVWISDVACFQVHQFPHE